MLFRVQGFLVDVELDVGPLVEAHGEHEADEGGEIECADEDQLSLDYLLSDFVAFVLELVLLRLLFDHSGYLLPTCLYISQFKYSAYLYIINPIYY